MEGERLKDDITYLSISTCSYEKNEIPGSSYFLSRKRDFRSKDHEVIFSELWKAHQVIEDHIFY